MWLYGVVWCGVDMHRGVADHFSMDVHVGVRCVVCGVSCVWCVVCGVSCVWCVV